MFSPIHEILDELRAGRMIVLTDDEGRENEGDLVLPAQFASADAVNFMLTEARGYMCLALTEADCDRLALHPQSPANTSVRGTAFTVSIDGHPRRGFTTGVSAHERAATIRLAIDPSSKPEDFVRPGHINPLRSRDGGVLVRIGQTEGSVDLCRLAGLHPSAVIIEIMREDGEMARVPDLERFCARHRLKMCSVAQLIAHRLHASPIVQRLAPAEGRTLRTPEGDFTLLAFRSMVDALPHLALTVGGVGRLGPDGAVVESAEPTLVRVHRRDLLGDVFDDLDSSPAGPTGRSLRSALRLLQREGRGVALYLRPTPAGEGWRQALQRPFNAADDDAPARSVGHDALEYGTGSQILRALGLSRLRLITNSQTDYPHLQAFGLEIAERVPLPDAPPPAPPAPGVSPDAA